MACASHNSNGGAHRNFCEGRADVSDRSVVYQDLGIWVGLEYGCAVGVFDTGNEVSEGIDEDDSSSDAGRGDFVVVGEFENLKVVRRGTDFGYVCVIGQMCGYRCNDVSSLECWGDCFQCEARVFDHSHLFQG